MAVTFELTRLSGVLIFCSWTGDGMGEQCQDSHKFRVPCLQPLHLDINDDTFDGYRTTTSDLDAGEVAQLIR